MNPLVSIIVPVYNAEMYLANAISSVEQQSYANWELLLINDGSSDNSETIAKEHSFKNPKIKLISQVNRGVSKARQNGIAHSKGDFITFLDADDELPVTAIELLINNQLKTNSDIIVGGHLSLQESKTNVFLPKLRGSQTEDHVKAVLKGEILSTVWGNLYKAYLFKHPSNFPDLKIGEDLLTNLEIIVRDYPRIEILPEKVYHYHTRESSAMQDSSEKSAQNRMEFIKYLENFLIHHELKEKCKKEFAFRAIQIWTWLIFNKRKEFILDKNYKREFWEYYKESFSLLPKYVKRTVLLHWISPQLCQKIIRLKVKK